MAGGQISQLIRLFEQLPEEQANELMKRLLREQPLVAFRIAQKHFAFDDLRYADENGLASLIETVGEDVVVTALTGADDGLVRRFADQFGTGRVRTFIQDVDQSMARSGAVESARRTMLVKAMMLKRRGRLKLNRPGIES
ncbi:MAG: FliG C-terminal domain-containing protein [Myxococcota bacterium]|nr:FliG C-terminal domain-containing protein [Myxococcota bacterium]